MIKYKVHTSLFVVVVDIFRMIIYGDFQFSECLQKQQKLLKI